MHSAAPHLSTVVHTPIRLFANGTHKQAFRTFFINKNIHVTSGDDLNALVVSEMAQAYPVFQRLRFAVESCLGFGFHLCPHALSVLGYVQIRKHESSVLSCHLRGLIAILAGIVITRDDVPAALHKPASNDLFTFPAPLEFRLLSEVRS
jgi:hypothetical protein